MQDNDKQDDQANANKADFEQLLGDLAEQWAILLLLEAVVKFIGELRWLNNIWAYTLFGSVLVLFVIVLAVFPHAPVPLDTAVAALTVAIFFPPLRNSWASSSSRKWPIIVLPGLLAAAAFLWDPTGQGTEALRSVWQWPAFAITLVALSCTGLLLQGRFFNETPFLKITDSDVHRVARWVSLAVPLVFGLAALNDLRIETFPIALSKLESGGFSPLIGLLECATAFAIIVLLSWRQIGLFEGFAADLLTLLVSAALWIMPGWAGWCGPIVILMLGINTLTGWAMLTAKLRFWPWVGVVVWLLITAFLGQFEHHYKIQPKKLCGTLATESCMQEVQARRETASTHAARWVTNRLSQQGPAKQPVQAIIVIAEGGGMRAALYTSSILAELDRATHGRFFPNIYAMSGVSGGALGLASYVAAHAAKLSPDQSISTIHSYLEKDHLSPLLIGAWFGDMQSVVVPLYRIGGGLLRWLFPFVNWGDRDRALVFEDSLEERWPGPDRPMAFGIEEGLARSAADGGVSPMIMFDTTNANTGSLEVASNVVFDPASRGNGHHATPPRDAPCNVLDRLPRDQTLTLAGAAVLSARFPLVTPPGLVVMNRDGCYDVKKTEVHFVDGGLLDNSGALGAKAALNALVTALKSPDVPQNTSVRVMILRIYSSDQTPPGSQLARGRSISNEVDLRAPIQALWAARQTQSFAPLSELCTNVAHINAERSNDAAEQLAPIECNTIGPDSSLPEDRVLAKYWPHVSWLNAALDMSTDPRDGRYVPLGWLLGPSKDYVTAQAARVAQQIVPYLPR